MGENGETDRGDEELQKFNASTRAGRRNALTSLDADEVDTATLKLANRLVSVSTTEMDNENTANDNPSTSGTSASEPG